MAVKIKKNIRGLRPNRKGNIIDLASRLYLDDASVYLKDQIPKEMNKGVSPVKNGRWDKPYSKTYRQAIRRHGWFGKKETPINLRVSGELHNSLRVKRWGKRLIAKFVDKIADYHNKKGTGKKKAIRRMLPTEKGETWNDTINKGLDNIAKKTARLLVGKFR